MGKKLFSLCMALVLCLGLLPVTALAADGATVYVGNVELTGSTDNPAYAKTDESGTVTTTEATAENYNVMWDGSTLTLKNATIKEAEEYGNSRESMAIYRQSGDLNLALVGENTVDALGGGSAASCGIHVGGNLTIKGQDNGSLSVSGGDSGGSSYGIHAFDTITINSGSVNATSGEAKGDSVGIFAEDTSGNYQNSITINGGTVIATAGDAVGTGWYSCGIRVEGPITITGGTVNATGKSSKAMSSCGIYAVKAVTISGSTVTATGGTAGSGESSGIYAVTVPRFGELKVLIQDATVTATGMACTSGISSGIFAESEGSEGVDVQVAIEDSIVTATGGTAGTGSYGILATTTGTEKSADVTIKGNSVVRADMTGTEGDDGKPISSQTNTKENGIIFENGEGTVHGDVTLREDLTIAAGETLDIPSGTSLTIPEGTTLTNNGRIQNDGDLQVKGEITGNAVTGSGTIQGSGQWPGKPEPVPIPPTYAVTTPETTGGTVTVSPTRASSGRTVTITATPDTGFALESLTVLDSRGNEIALTDKGDGKYTFTMPASRVTVEASFTPAPLPFEDVAPGAWYEEAVRYAYFHNIMEGMRETEFAPATALTRAMAVQILYNLEGQPDLSSENLGYPYEDVDAQAWYGNAVYWARIAGVATGYGDGTFQPGDSITRQEVGPDALQLRQV
ncbi:MAG: S-layer homology domain-containing protein [Acutalibacter sp.]